VQEPMRPADNSSLHPFSAMNEANLDRGVAKSGVKGPLIVGSTLERSWWVVNDNGNPEENGRLQSR